MKLLYGKKFPYLKFVYADGIKQKAIDYSNQEITSIADQIRGQFQWSNVYVLSYGFEANDNRQDLMHPSENGIQKILATFRKNGKDFCFQFSPNETIIRQLGPKQPFGVQNVVKKLQGRKFIFQKSLETHQTKKSDLNEQIELKQTRAQII